MLDVFKKENSILLSIWQWEV